MADDAPQTGPRPAIRLSGKRLLLGVLALLILFLGVLYAVIVPMHFGAKERLQEEYRQKQLDQESAFDSAAP